jgi:hypothetical protein
MVILGQLKRITAVRIFIGPTYVLRERAWGSCMDRDILIALFNNATFAVGTILIYEVVYLLPLRNRHIQLTYRYTHCAYCSAVMSMPFTLQSGIIFDTRSILISVTALIFGAILP